MQKFRLNTLYGGQPGGKINYMYTCCSVNGTLDQATLDLKVPEAEVTAMSHDQLRRGVITLLEAAEKCGAKGWQLRVWNFPNAGSGEIPGFDLDTGSFNMPEPPIIDKEVTGMMYDDQKWIQLGAPADNFAAVLTGFLDVKEAGEYNFWTESDDGSWL